MACNKYVVPEVVFGSGALDLAGRHAISLGARRVMVVSDAGVIDAGWTERVTKNLSASGIECVLFDHVTPNPRDHEVMEGAEAYLRSGCNALVAVGGGSPMDCAKGIGVVATNGGHIRDFEGVDKIQSPAPPLLCVPTTGGTSADVSQFCIVADTERRMKMALVSKSLVPDVALVDPRVLTTMSPYLTACTGLDALTHAIEALVSTGGSRMTALHAIEAIRLLGESLVASLESPEDASHRESVMFASFQAGLAFSNASLGAVHAMAHALGGWLDLPHGECNAILLPHVLAYNASRAEQYMRPLAGALGLDSRGRSSREVCATVLDHLRDLRFRAGIRETLAQKGVRHGDIPVMSRFAAVDPCMVTNPRPASERDIEVLYGEAL